MASHSVSTGTITNPPPTPKNPVSAPDEQPGDDDALERRVRAVAALVLLARASPGQRGREQHQRHEREDQRARRRPTARQRAEQRADGRGRGEGEREPPAHVAVAGERAGADRGSDRHHHERGGRRRPDRLVEHVDEHRKRQDRAATADRADNHADRQPEDDRECGHEGVFYPAYRIGADIVGVARLPLMLRALVLVPLLAVGLDQARASFVCGPDAQSCLEAAGQGWLGAAGTLLLVAYMVGIAALVARLARGRSAPPLLWVVATAGLWAACGGQALLASALGAGAAFGGGWVPLLAFGAAAGALLALALRVVPALARALRLGRSAARSRARIALLGAAGMLGRRTRFAASRETALHPCRLATAANCGIERRAAVSRLGGASTGPVNLCTPLRGRPTAHGDRAARTVRITNGAPMTQTKRELRDQRRAARQAAEQRRRRRRDPPPSPVAARRSPPASPRSSVAVAVAVSNSSEHAEPAANAAATLVAGIPEKNGVLGDPDAPITVTEYLDLQCPICAEASKQTLPTLIDNYVKTGKVKLQARTLSFLGPDSVRAAKFAAGAEQQGKPVGVPGDVLRVAGHRELRLRDRRLPARGRARRPASTPTRRCDFADTPPPRTRSTAPTATPQRVEGRLHADVHRQARQRRRARSSPSA